MVDGETGGSQDHSRALLALVGRTPRSAGDPLVAHPTLPSDAEDKPTGGSAADQGVRPTNHLGRGLDTASY
jgi:hypothetical protein